MQGEWVIVFSMAPYDTVHAPPATVLLHAEQFQMPTAFLLTVCLPQNVLCRYVSTHSISEGDQNARTMCIYRGIISNARLAVLVTIDVPCMLRDFHLLHLLTKRSTISSAVLAGD